MTAVAEQQPIHYDGASEIYARAAQILLAYHDARAGDPWPFIELQWGRVLTAAEVLADVELPDRLRAAGERFLILDDFQRDMIERVADPATREIYVKGNTGCGKGGAAGIAVCLYFAIWDDAKVVLTRDTFRSAKKVIFAEVAKWWRRMAAPPAGIVVGTESLYHAVVREHEVSVASPDADEGFSGVHSPHVLFVFDEATAPGLASRFSLKDTQATKFLALANPRTTSGPFYDGFRRWTDEPNRNQTVVTPHGRRRLITVDGADTVNVKARRLKHPVSPPGGIEIDGERIPAGIPLSAEQAQRFAPIIPGQTCFDEWLGLKSHPDPNWVACFAHGHFPGEDIERQLIFGSWITPNVRWWARWTGLRRRHEQRLRDGRGLGSSAAARLRRIMPIEAFGLDVGGSKHGDPSVLTVGGRGGILQQHVEQLDDAPAIAEWVVRLAKSYGVSLASTREPVCVDMDGLGWGVGGILSQMGVRVIEFRGNESPQVEPQRYVNRRTEAYGEFAKRIDPGGQWRGVPFAIPDDALLHEELRCPEKVYQADGFRFALPPKHPVAGRKQTVQSITERIGRSPDRADSAVYFLEALRHVGIRLEETLETGFW